MRTYTNYVCKVLKKCYIWYPIGNAKLAKLMAIYHFSAQIISRSSGKSATAAAAYRAAEKIKDKRTGQTYDYTQKKGVDFSEIIAPKSAPKWVFNREELWNKVEAEENRKNSRLAREINVAIPTELNRKQQLKLVKDFAKDQFVNEGMIADINYHDLDSQNPHAHIMLTTREIDGEGFSAKKNRNWDKKELLLKQRKAWADYTNAALGLAGISQTIDHRSYEERGIELIPQIHLGAAVNAMEKRGISTIRGNRYAEIEKANQKIKREKLQDDLKLIGSLETSYRKDSSEPKAVCPVSLEKQREMLGMVDRYLGTLMQKNSYKSKKRGTGYDIVRTEDITEVSATDGRGVILKLEKGKITAGKLTEKDFEMFKEANEKVDREMVEIMLESADRYLSEHVKKDSHKSSKSSGYNLSRDRKTNSMEIHAADGRGLILSVREGKIQHSSFKDEDFQKFRAVNKALKKKREKQQVKQAKQAKQVKNSKKRSR